MTWEDSELFAVFERAFLVKAAILCATDFPTCYAVGDNPMLFQSFFDETGSPLHPFTRLFKRDYLGLALIIQSHSHFELIISPRKPNTTICLRGRDQPPSFLKLAAETEESSQLGKLLNSWDKGMEHILVAITMALGEAFQIQKLWKALDTPAPASNVRENQIAPCVLKQGPIGLAFKVICLDVQIFSKELRQLAQNRCTHTLNRGSPDIIEAMQNELKLIGTLVDNVTPPSDAEERTKLWFALRMQKKRSGAGLKLMRFMVPRLRALVTLAKQCKIREEALKLTIQKDESVHQHQSVTYRPHKATYWIRTVNDLLDI